MFLAYRNRDFGKEGQDEVIAMRTVRMKLLPVVARHIPTTSKFIIVPVNF
jgi:hypothetical protein